MFDLVSAHPSWLCHVESRGRLCQIWPVSPDQPRTLHLGASGPEDDLEGYDPAAFGEDVIPAYLCGFAASGIAASDAQPVSEEDDDGVWESFNVWNTNGSQAGDKSADAGVTWSSPAVNLPMPTWNVPAPLAGASSGQLAAPQAPVPPTAVPGDLHDTATLSLNSAAGAFASDFISVRAGSGPPTPDEPALPSWLRPSAASLPDSELGSTVQSSPAVQDFATFPCSQATGGAAGAPAASLADSFSALALSSPALQSLAHVAIGGGPAAAAYQAPPVAEVMPWLTLAEPMKTGPVVTAQQDATEDFDDLLAQLMGA